MIFDIKMELPKKIGIIAGSGSLPIEIAHFAQSSGIDIHLSRINGMSEDILPELNGSCFGLGEFGKRMKALKDGGYLHIIFAGYVNRPDFSTLKFDTMGLVMLPSILAAAKKGDDAIMRAILGHFEKAGFIVFGPEVLQKELIAPLGAIGAVKPTKEQMFDIETAARAAYQIGKLDIGQGCVVSNGLVLAVEAQEGTDAMLKRILTLPKELRGTEKLNGVLCKRPKPIQEKRIDLPTIGMTTLENVIAAELSGIAIEAGGALIAQKQSLIKMADEAGVFIYGFDESLGQT